MERMKILKEYRGQTARNKTQNENTQFLERGVQSRTKEMG
jgi:hypothetical protein